MGFRHQFSLRSSRRDSGSSPIRPSLLADAAEPRPLRWVTRNRSPSERWRCSHRPRLRGTTEITQRGRRGAHRERALDAVLRGGGVAFRATARTTSLDSGAEARRVWLLFDCVAHLQARVGISCVSVDLHTVVHSTEQRLVVFDEHGKSASECRVAHSGYRV